MTGLRMRFQLTPLLDLLLIVVFAQFLEGKRADEARAERAEEAITESVAEVEAERAELETVRERLVAENERLRQERERAVQLARAAARTARDATSAAGRSAEFLTDLLDIPPDVAALMRPEPRSDAAEDLAAAKQRIAELRERKGFEVLRFLVGYEELLKRAEIWTLHVRGGGFVSLSTASGVELLRLEADGQRERAEEFVRKLFAAAKILPQPKGLVILLVSYDRTATARVYQPVLDGLGEAVRRLETDQGGRTQFEFAVLGAAPEPEASRDAAVDTLSSGGGAPPPRPDPPAAQDPTP